MEYPKQKKIKPPHEPKTFNYPRMYASFTWRNEDGRVYSHPTWCRLRIIEPDGRCTYFDDERGHSLGSPCWTVWLINPTPQECVKDLKEYCRSRKTDCVYIGEIR